MNFRGQFDEDHYVSQFFPDGFLGVAVDIGASDGLNFNNTYAYEQVGWTVLCVEPNPLYFDRLKENRRLAISCAISDIDGVADFSSYEIGHGGYEAVSALEPNQEMFDRHRHLIMSARDFKVPTKRMDTLLEQAGVHRIDLMNIDVEGGEDAVFRGFSLDKYRPRVIMLEQWPNATTFCKERLENGGYQKLTRLGDNNDIWQRL